MLPLPKSWPQVGAVLGLVVSRSLLAGPDLRVDAEKRLERRIVSDVRGLLTQRAVDEVLPTRPDVRQHHEAKTALAVAREGQAVDRLARSAKCCDLLGVGQRSPRMSSEDR